MSKFQKKILKTSNRFENCLLIGEGFGFLDECLEIFKSVFVINKQKPNIRVKNLIYRDDTENLSEISSLTHIFFDLNQITMLEKYQYLWTKHDSLIIIEGNDPIGREFSKSLYASGWQCTSTSGFFHTWEKIK